MTVQQHMSAVGKFAHYLRELATLLDPGQGWYGVFCARDPHGMRACFDGTEVPPWDVVESLLQDLAVLRGTRHAAQESERAAALYSASVGAHDRRPGGRQALVDRLGLMTREQAYAAHRLRAAGAEGASTEDADAEALAWARDDHTRATARCAELRSRLTAVESAGPGHGPGAERVPRPRGAGSVLPDPASGGPAGPPDDGVRQERDGVPDEPYEPARPAPAPGRGKPRGARFAGLDPGDDAGPSPLPTTHPALPGPSAGSAAPRGARFRGAPADGTGSAGSPPTTTAAGPAARLAADETVGLLVRLRAQGRSGEAHAVLCEAAVRPAAHLPVLAVALHRAGLAADWATLLWEVSSLQPAQLAAAAGALASAGRAEDCGQVLRQGVARPAAEIADAVVALDRAGLEPEARALLGAFVRVRSAQDAARIAEGGPDGLVPRLLAAAREVSAARERDLVHALRVAGTVTP
ncbi:hypothetical protein [Streptomyces sp. B1I3]|uniref:hypothetical protein n=1 Tax=Streptomyces sp. B1I3 TaxID=3042264 RepID=UPI002788818A|nr:hypothetical protein [Streptomyces sp. B1I3]MDQ0793043.1 hypothetical protein [Streptomyces sp. B1I3]